MRLTDRDRVSILLKVSEYNEMAAHEDNITVYMSKHSINLNAFRDSGIECTIMASEFGMDQPLEDVLISMHELLDRKIKEQHEKRMDRFTGPVETA